MNGTTQQKFNRETSLSGIASALFLILLPSLTLAAPLEGRREIRDRSFERTSELFRRVSQALMVSCALAPAGCAHHQSIPSPNETTHFVPLRSPDPSRTSLDPIFSFITGDPAQNQLVRVDAPRTLEELVRLYHASRDTLSAPALDDFSLIRLSQAPVGTDGFLGAEAQPEIIEPNGTTHAFSYYRWEEGRAVPEINRIQYQYFRAQIQPIVDGKALPFALVFLIPHSPSLDIYFSRAPMEREFAEGDVPAGKILVGMINPTGRDIPSLEGIPPLDQIVPLEKLLSQWIPEAGVADSSLALIYLRGLIDSANQALGSYGNNSSTLGFELRALADAQHVLNNVLSPSKKM